MFESIKSFNFRRCFTGVQMNKKKEREDWYIVPDVFNYLG